MAFPQTALPAHVYIAPGVPPDGSVEDFLWTDITADARIAAGISIDQGRGDEAGQVDAGKCSLNLRNVAGKYSPRNPNSIYYPDLRRNTPLRVTVEAVRDTFGRSRLVEGTWGTASDTGGAWTHVGDSGVAASWSVTGTEARQSFAAANIVRYVISAGRARDLDATYRVRASAIITGSSCIAAFVARYVDVSNMILCRVEFDAAGAVTAKISRWAGGVHSELASLNPIPALTYTAAGWLRVRVQIDGSRLRMKVWPDGGTEADEWTLTISDSSVARPGRVGMYYWLLAGNSNAYPLHVDIDDYVVEAVRFTGTVPEWPVRWDQSGRDETSPITAAGAFRRLQQGQAPLRSAIYRNLSALSPIGYWPLEDEAGTTAASSVVNGVKPAVVGGITFAGDTAALPGAASTVSVTDVSTLTARVAAHTATGAWSALVYVRLDSLPAADTPILEVAASGTQKRWRVSVAPTGWVIQAWDASDTITVNVLSAFGADSTDIPVDRFVAVHMGITTSGASTGWAIERHGVGETNFWQNTGTVAASSPGSPTTVFITGSAGLNAGRLGHLLVANYGIPFTDADFIASSNGHIGETAAARITRLCDQEGLPALVESVTSGVDESEPMGRQLVDTLLGNLRACEAADMGVLYEQGFGIGYLPRYVRYNPTTNLALNFNSGHIAEAPEPTDDDQRMRNDWTVSRKDGGESRVTDEAHVAAYGRYDDSVEINIASDERLPHHASWRLMLGTVDELRWPHIALDLASRPTVMPIWMSLKIGSRITISNPPAAVAGTSIDLLLEGYTERLSYYDWTIDLNCSPTTPWLVAALDSTLAHADTEDSETDSDITTTATSVPVATNAGPIWTTAATDFPFDIDVGGERCTVTAISGASSPQTFTVTRSVNGIVKAHVAPTPVRLWRPSYIAL